MEKIVGAQGRRDRVKGQGYLVKVETIRKIVRAGIGVAERRQSEDLLNEVQDAPEIVRDVGDVLAFV